MKLTSLCIAILFICSSCASNSTKWAVGPEDFPVRVQQLVFPDGPMDSSNSKTYGVWEIQLPSFEDTIIFWGSTRGMGEGLLGIQPLRCTNVSTGEVADLCYMRVTTIHYSGSGICALLLQGPDTPNLQISISCPTSYIPR